MNTTPQGKPMTHAVTLAIARQPILDAKRRVIGHELYDRTLNRKDFTAASDATLLFNLLSNADSEVASGQQLIFINCTHQTLAAGHLELIDPERVVLEIAPMPAAHAAPEDIETYWLTLAKVHQRGFKLAFTESVLAPAYESWLRLASFIKLDVSQLDDNQLQAIVAQAGKVTAAKLVAEKIETAQQFEHAKALGLHLFQGFWFAKPVLIKGQIIRPAQAAIIQLINLVRKQASTAEIEEVLKHDPTLSFNLLRFINSAGFGLSCEVTSFKHAVMILGLKNLFRWAALLMTSTGAGADSPAVGNAAVVRGRLMELLAAELLPPEECDNAFVVGIFSLLDTMMGITLEDALASISLPQTVTDALLHHQGLLAPFLQLTLACESADDTAFAETTTALQLTGDQVNWAHLQALAWAENMTQA